jgi:hypothetical protein
MVSVVRCALMLAVSVCLLVPWTPAAAAPQQADGLQAREERVQRQFDRVSRNFSIGPYYAAPYYFSRFSPYYFASRYVSSYYFSRPEAYAADRGAYAPARTPSSLPSNFGAPSEPYRVVGNQYTAANGPQRPEPEVTLPLSRGQRLTDLVLISGVRALLYLAAIGLLAQIAPRKMWAQILDRNNTALAIVLAAIALALGIVISMPLG